MVKMTKNSAIGGLLEPIKKQCYLEISAARGSAARGLGVANITFFFHFQSRNSS